MLAELRSVVKLFEVKGGLVCSSTRACTVNDDKKFTVEDEAEVLRDTSHDGS